MSLVNITIDDFDPPVVYSNYGDWQTPNPQDHPDWWNATREVTGVPWHEATYHYTTVAGAQSSLNFTGSTVFVYGAVGPTTSNYTITIDPTLAQPFSQSYSTSNATEGRTLLYSTTELSYAPHTLQVTNEGSGLLLDLFVLEVELGAEGSTLTNDTIDEVDPGITYQGDWTRQDGPFFGGTSDYTQGPGNSFSYSFEGSAIYIYGDQVNDHGPYSVYFNGSSAPYGTYTGRSGCGGGYDKYCEKLGGMIFVANNLPMGTHNLTLVNGGPTEGDLTFFDFDRLVVTTPSAYPTQSLQVGDCPFTYCSGGGSGTAPSGNPGGAASPTGTAGSSASSSSVSIGAAPAGMEIGPGALLGMLGVWFLRKFWT